MVFYRKYRPQRITDLDSKSLREKLTSVLSDSDATPHAFLFTGPKGLGKTSTARIVAKVINCEKNSKGQGEGQKSGDIEPCNVCDSCLSITSGTNMDILEIDAASNRGIDEIRDLKEKVKLSPLSAKKKVYIIDEVHMLTTEAFNALLKTLEEPPAHVIFVLCTTEPQKVPATILSRCCHIMFAPATSEELVRSFKRIADGEKIKIDEAVLGMIAELSDSGFRDGAKILEEIVMMSKGKEITSEMIEENYRVSSMSYQIEEMVKAMSLKDTKSAIEVVERLSIQGIDIKYFLVKFLERLHKELLVVVGVEKSSVESKNFTRQELQYLLEIFSKAGQEMKFSVLPQLPIELAIVEYCLTMQNKAEDADMSAELRGNESNGALSEVKVTTETVTLKTMRKNLGTMAKIKALYGEEAPKQETDGSIKTEGVDLLHYDTNTDTKEWMDALWRSIISEMKSHNHTIAGVLRGCRLASYDKKSVVIETVYKFHKEKLDEAKTMLALESVCKELTGNTVSVSVVLKSK